MKDTDLELRRLTYAFFVEHGRAPVAAERGEPEKVVAGWRRLTMSRSYSTASFRRRTGGTRSSSPEAR